MKCLLKNFPLSPLGCFSSSSCPTSTFSPSFRQSFLLEEKEPPLRPKRGSLYRLRGGGSAEGVVEETLLLLGIRIPQARRQGETPRPGRKVEKEVSAQKA